MLAVIPGPADRLSRARDGRMQGVEYEWVGGALIVY